MRPPRASGRVGAGPLPRARVGAGSLPRARRSGRRRVAGCAALRAGGAPGGNVSVRVGDLVLVTPSGV
ncbi:class II aldolase/adducin family protein, partial [Streptomyces fradiae]